MELGAFESMSLRAKLWLYKHESASPLLLTKSKSSHHGPLSSDFPAWIMLSWRYLASDNGQLSPSPSITHRAATKINTTFRHRYTIEISLFYERRGCD